jgi:hypothetical protein
VSLQSKHRTPPCPSSEFSQQPTVPRSSRNPSSATTLEVFFPLLLSTLPSRYCVETFRTPAESIPTGRSTTTPNWNCGDPTVFQLRVHQNHQNPPSLQNDSKSSAPQQSPLQQPERQLLSIETAAIGLFFGSASTKTPPLPTHSSPPNFGVNRVHQLSRNSEFGNPNLRVLRINQLSRNWNLKKKIKKLKKKRDSSQKRFPKKRFHSKEIPSQVIFPRHHFRSKSLSSPQHLVPFSRVPDSIENKFFTASLQSHFQRLSSVGSSR